ncbi:hypothetical protein BKA62DRAFT_681351, partial [Auriculariales sp. MPI-PUGE-AT-0066]
MLSFILIYHCLALFVLSFCCRITLGESPNQRDLPLSHTLLPRAFSVNLLNISFHSRISIPYCQINQRRLAPWL